MQIKTLSPLTFLGIEEHESLIQRNSIIIRRRRAVVVAGDGLDNKCDKPNEETGGQNGPHRPKKDLAADDDATQIHVLLLLLLAWAQQPALLRLVQRPRHRRPVEVVQVAAPVVVRRRVRRVYLQWPAPWISPVHTHLSILTETQNEIEVKLDLGKWIWSKISF